NGADEHLGLLQPAPRVLPEPSRNSAVQPAHADRLVSQPERGICRAEPFARVARALASQVHEPVEVDAYLLQVRAEQVPHETGLEVVAARGDGRVRGEDDAGARDEARLLERHLSR